MAGNIVQSRLDKSSESVCRYALSRLSESYATKRETRVRTLKAAMRTAILAFRGTVIPRNLGGILNSSVCRRGIIHHPNGNIVTRIPIGLCEAFCQWRLAGE